MEKKLAAKSNAPELLDRQLKLRTKKNQYGFIVMASATDPYLQLEEKAQLSRRLIEIMLTYNFPLHIITKSNLILRDLDLLKELNQTAILPNDLQDKLPGGVIVTFSFSTTNEKIGKIFEPGAPSPAIRLETMKTIKENGFLTGVSMMPMIPYISDRGEHLEEMFSAFKENGADYVMPADLWLGDDDPFSNRTLMFRAVKKHYPELLPKYEKLFHNSPNLPAYYRKAFYLKMQELGEKFGIRDRILE